MYIKAEIWTVGRTEYGTAALLRLPSSSRCVPIYLESPEAQAILEGLSGVRNSPRTPLELLVAMADTLSLCLESIEIASGEQAGEYMARLNYSGSDTKISLNARTADALALAVRCNTPIFLDEELTLNDSIGVSMAEPDLPFALQLERLHRELDLSVLAEDYEQAARIRDRILQIESRPQTEAS